MLPKMNRTLIVCKTRHVARVELQATPRARRSSGVAVFCTLIAFCKDKFD